MFQYTDFQLKNVDPSYFHGGEKWDNLTIGDAQAMAITKANWNINRT